MKKWKRGMTCLISAALLVSSAVTSTASGWQYGEAGWSYQNTDGTYQKSGWFQDIDTKWYYFDSDGHMLTDWLQDVDGRWYYMNPDGSMATGWVQPDGNWYYLNLDGSMATGWVQPDHNWYYMNSNGSMLTGWLQDTDGKWYYLNPGSGEMLTGTIEVDGVKWNMESSGAWDGSTGKSTQSTATTIIRQDNDNDSWDNDWNDDSWNDEGDNDSSDETDEGNDNTESGHQHDYDSTVKIAAGCMLDGVALNTCSVCGHSYESAIPALGHTAGEWKVSKEATDMETGEKLQSCTVCNTTLGKQIIDKLPHVCERTTLIDSRAASCSAEGYEVYQCKCGEEDRVVLPKTAHDDGKWQTVTEATYTEVGLKQRVCNSCGTVLESLNIPIQNHEHDYQLVDSLEPTCTDDGYNQTKCSICGDVQLEIKPARGHGAPKKVTDQEANCSTIKESGHYECVECGETTGQWTGSYAAHNPGEWETSIEATCSSTGKNIKKCTECETVLSFEMVWKLPHTYGEWETDIAEFSCQSAGLKTRTCSVCGFIDKTISQVAHHFVDNVCTVCGQSSENAHTHVYDVTSRAESTCTTEGSATYSCDCGETIVITSDKLNHTAGEWEEAQSEQACVKKEVKKCTGCGLVMEEQETVIPHDCNYVTSATTEATCTVDGSKEETCTLCGNTRTEVIKAQHKYGAPVVVKNCTEGGTSTITCTACGDAKVTNLVATGHNYVQTSKENASCTKAGSVTYTCSNCNDSYTEPLAQLEHSYSVTDSVAATCVTGGYDVEICVGCGHTRQTNQTEALGHVEGEWVTTKEAALGVAGSKEVKCTKCNATIKTEEIPMLMTDGVDSVYYIDVGTDTPEIVIGHYNEEWASEMNDLVNAHRESIGKTPLTMKNTQYDYTRAAECAYLFSHTRPRGCGVLYSENIAFGPYHPVQEFYGPQEIFDAWLASEGHKKNIEADRTHNMTGICVFWKRCPIYSEDGTETGRYVYEQYWVQTFD